MNAYWTECYLSFIKKQKKTNNLPLLYTKDTRSCRWKRLTDTFSLRNTSPWIMEPTTWQPAPNAGSSQLAGWGVCSDWGAASLKLLESQASFSSMVPSNFPRDLPFSTASVVSFRDMSLKLLQLASLLTLSVKSEVAQSCPTLCNPTDGSLPGSAIPGIFQTRIREWAAISFSSGPSQPRDQTQVSCTADRRFTVWATREAHAHPLVVP